MLQRPIKQKRGLQGIQGKTPSHEIDGHKIRFQKSSGAWGEWLDLTPKHGDKGDKGEPGDTGPQGLQGAAGVDGQTPDIQPVIETLYQELAKIPPAKEGKDGLRGPRGPKGEPGKDGLSAYEIWLRLGYEGTEEDFFEWLVEEVLKRIKLPAASVGAGGAVRITGGFGYSISSGSSLDISPGIKGFISVPYNMTVTEWTIIADQAGSAILDLWVSPYSTSLPDASDSITGSAKPEISGSNTARSSNLTGWKKALKAGDLIVFYIDSISGIKNMSFNLRGRRT